MKIMLNDLRCGFASFYRPEAFGEGEPAYQAALMIPHNHPAVKLLDATVLQVATEKWKTEAKAKAVIKAIENDRKKMAWQKTEYTNDEGVPYDGFDGCYYLRLRNEIQPLLLDQDAEEVAKGRPGAPYSGCHVIVQADIWAQDNTFGKGIRAKLLGVQFVRDGDAFAGGARASKEDFKSLAVSQDEPEGEDEFA